MTLELRTVANGVQLPIHAQPGSRRNGVTGVHDGRLKVAMTQVAEKGKANQFLLKLLAEALGIPVSQLRLTAGSTSPRKTVLVTGLSAEEIRQRLNPPNDK